jgi:hypothetical protein
MVRSIPIVGLLVACILAGCGPARPGVEGPGSEPADAGAVAPPADEAKTKARTFVSEVKEENLLLENEEAAKEYLRQKLVGLLVERLFQIGFEQTRASTLATTGRLEEFGVQGHEEKVVGQGAEQGLISEKMVWDVRGRLRVVLSDDDVAGLGQWLDRLSLDSMEEVETVSGYLKRFADLQPDPGQLSELQRKAGDRWAGLIEPYIRVQLDREASEVEPYMGVLQRMSSILKQFHQLHPDHSKYAELQKLFTRAALKVLKTKEVKAENYPAIREMLDRIGKIAGSHLPGVSPYLMRDVELAWRDRLEELDKKKTPFPAMKPDFLLFMETFPRSDFYPELELRFLNRWIEYLLAASPKNMDELVGYRKEVKLLSERFPSLTNLSQVHAVLGKRCIEVLSRVSLPHLDAVARVRQAVKDCDPFMPAGMDLVNMRERIDRREELLLRQKDDREEKKALKDLTFFIRWDRAMRKLSWGKPRKNWAGTGPFSRLWAGGKEAGANCRCTLDPDEPCRAFEEGGARGGFEVVARFYGDHLSGVDLCQVLVGRNIPALYGFFSRRYQKSHSGSEAALFLSGGGGTGGGIRSVRFGSRDRLVVTLECGQDTCTVRYRHGPTLAARERDEKLAREREEDKQQKDRQKRIRRGWRPGDCVHWDCAKTCRYTGRVKKRSQGRYLVEIIRDQDDPKVKGTNVWAEEKDLYDCSDW